MKTCGAKTRGTGAPCKRPAGAGTDHVGWGKCKLHGGRSPSGRAAAAKEEAKAEAARIGVELDTDPAEALLLAVRLVAGEVEHLRSKIRQLEDGEGDPDLNVLASALASATERLSRVAKTAADAGVAGRQLELDEAVVARLAEAVRAALAEVELTADQQVQLRESMTHHLAALDGLDWRRPRELTA